MPILEEVELIFILSILLLVGYVGSFLARKVRLPEVTGYIAAGIVVKQVLLGFRFLSERKFEVLFGRDLVPINHLALGLIAFAVCGSLRIDQLRRLSRGILSITVVQALATFVIVSSAVLLAVSATGLLAPEAKLATAGVALALVLGGIATATAPAATVAVVRELRTKGPFTTTLLATVALDDAIALLIFAFGLTIGESLLAGHQIGGAGWLHGLVVGPAVEIAGSLAAGALIGLVHHLVARRLRREMEMLTLSLGVITFTSGLSMLIGLSPLLTIMAAGFVLINCSRRNQRVFGAIERFEGPIFVVFFTLAGTQIHLENLLTCGIIGSVFIASRFGGKVAGAFAGAVLAKAGVAVRRYLGFALIPQAGVAIGLMLVAQQSPEFSPYRRIIVDIVLASVALNELVGPPLAAYALRRAGEAQVAEAA